jgi:hypothetical protein
MKYLLILSLVLAGCSTTVPVTMKFPDAPEELFQSCEDLEKVPADTKQLSVTAEVVIRNYGRYHTCSLKNEVWQQWYKEQKKIFDSVK